MEYNDKEHKDLLDKMIKVTQDLAVDCETFLEGMGLFNDALLRVMAIEMIEKGYCDCGNGMRLHLEDAGERFLEIYNEELTNKTVILSGDDK